MFAGAEHCVECGNLQDWRRKVLVWKDVFATIPIFIGVVGAIVSVFQFAPSPNINVLDVKCSGDRATFSITNTGNRAGLLRLDGLFGDQGLATTARFSGDNAAATVILVEKEKVIKAEVLYTIPGVSGVRELRIATGSSLRWMWTKAVRCS